MKDYRSFVPEQRFQPAIALSPDGREVAFSSNASGQFNLWVQPVDGGDARRLTDYVDDAVREMAWSPDGRRLAFAADHHGDEQTQIYLVSAYGGSPQRLTTALDRQHVLGVRPFTPDGRHLLIGANDRDETIQDVLLLDLTDGTARRFESSPGVVLHPWSISPDGNWALAAGMRSNTDCHSYLIDLTDPGAKPIAVTAPLGDAYWFPGPWGPDSSGFYVLTDTGREFTGLSYFDLGDHTARTIETPPWDIEDVGGSDDGRTLAWIVNTAGHSVLHVRRDGEPDHTQTLPPGVITAFDLARDGAHAATLIDTATRPSEVAILDLESDGITLLTDTRPAGLRDLTPGRPITLTTSATDGTELSALWYQPDGPGPYPVLVSIHGGPEDQERPRYSALYQCLLAQGIAIFAPNVRGSAGFGKTYQKRIYRDWGGIDISDLTDLLTELQQRDDVDPNRIAVYGASYGGFMALTCLTRLPGKWAAGVSICGPTNLATLVESVPPTWREMVTDAIGDPETDADHLIERSPLTRAELIDAPLFIVQGAHDPRVPLAEAEQIVQALRGHNIEVRYDIYDDEGHGFTNKKNELQALSDVTGFIQDHLRARPGATIGFTPTRCDGAQ